MSESSESTGDRPEDDDFGDEDSDEESFSLLRVVAAIGGLGLVGSYFLTWVTIVDAEAIVDAGGLSDRTISASEIYLFPEVVAALGGIALVVAVIRWSRPAHLGVLLVGILGISASLAMRGFLDSGETLIEVGGEEGPASAFEPAIGVTVALVAAALLIASGFGAFLGSFDRWPTR
jgi:hypothetical protein